VASKLVIFQAPEARWLVHPGVAIDALTEAPSLVPSPVARQVRWRSERISLTFIS